jgi:hypothetical protein
MPLHVFGGFSLGLVIVLLLAFGLLTWLGIPTGRFLDWVIGGASFWWLVVIVTVPWNVYFRAKAVLTDAEESQAKGIAVAAPKLSYVQMLAQRSLWVALGLHLLSAVTLYLLAAFGVSAIGYIGSVAALLLTLLRPAIRTYDYIAARLFSIQQEFQYPREDVVQLRDRVNDLSQQLKTLQQQLNPQDPTAWAAIQEKQLQATRNDLTRLGSNLETLRRQNQSEHERLSQEAQSAIAQLSEDSRFLGNVREIIRFIKES